MSNNYKFTFVILHYLTIEDTTLCIDSIKNNCLKYNYNIVVVDNASPNKTGLKLKSKYKNDSKISILLNSENLGFAKGNNVGFKYSKINFNPDFIILCNNDTVLLNNDFCEKIINEYKKSHFAVMGPKIILKDGSSNKIPINNYDIKTLKKQYKKLLIKYIICNSLLLFYFKKMIKRLLIRKRKNNRQKLLNPDERHENIVLHGAFLVFSKIYIDKFNGLDDRTFLYREEEFLHKRIMDNKMKTIYSPDIVIKHNEDSSTNAMNKNKRSKEIFVCKHELDSTKKLIKYMEE